MTQEQGASLRDRAAGPTDLSRASASSRSSIPSALSGHWDTLEGCYLAEEYSTKTRADLCHGELSDFALANRQFMASRSDLDLIVWQTAAKERIRWLSAQLAQAMSARESQDPQGLGPKAASAVGNADAPESPHS